MPGTQPKPISLPRAVASGGKSGAKNTAYTMQRRLNSNKVHEYSLVNDFTKSGYRNREDITILPPGVLVQGSYNVLTRTTGRVGVVKGYTLDGEADTALEPITSSYDFTKILSNDRHVRTKNSRLQFRYVHPITGVISWVTIFSGLTSGNNVNYTAYWDNTQLTTVLLFVNQTPRIYRWSAGVVGFASATPNSITKLGTRTWAQEGFDTTGSVTINGTDYTYTGGTGTTTLTGVTPDPSLAAYPTGTAVAQTVTFIQNSATSVIPNTFNNALIGNLDNQIFIGALDSSIIYTSKVNDYTNYSQSTVRLVGEGNVGTILDYPTAFVNQDDTLQIAAGKDIWYQTVLTDTTSVTYPGGTSNPSVSVTYQTLTYNRLKTTALQAARSQACVTKIKNNIAFLSFEPIVNSLGTVEDFLNSPQTTDLSYSIINDMNRYDFTDASMIYFRQFLYLSVPREGLIRVYNMTNPKTHYWEAPVTYPIARWSIIDDELYGHGYTVPETYKLFTGYTFKGHPIPAAAYFSYEQYGTRSYPKDFNLFYLEGYITQNCVLNYGMNFDIDGCQTTRSYTLNGTDRRLVCISSELDASLGKDSLGKRPLGGLTQADNTATSTNQGLPPKFRAIKQMSKFPFYELQVFFTSLGTDQQWELISFGPNAGPATEGSNSRQY